MRRAGTNSKQIYRACTLVWHTKELRYIQPGETVNLDHLSSDEIEWLIKSNVVAPIGLEDREERNGTDN